VRDKAVLAEFAAAHHQQAAAGVDVAQVQPACLPGTQPETVAQREHRVIDLSASRCARAVGQLRRCGQQLPGLGSAEQERYPR